MKKYSEYMDEITPDDLYKGLLAYGMFSEKLPPIFTAEEFFLYCLSLPNSFSGGWYKYVSFDSMRNLNIPRQMSIPNPMAYQRLCMNLKDNWEYIKQHFHDYTDGETHKISRIHIRKMKNTNVLFQMNYDDWRKDGSPSDDLLLGKRYIVKADISTCFPSIYTHSLCWAFVGKDEAKRNRNGNYWYNELDKLSMEIRNGETHGLMIGPHSSNLLAECILVVIDKHLFDKGWRYIRNIDDYTCYASNEEDAQKFLVDLANELRAFDMLLNYKKVSIDSLPTAAVEHWVRKMNTFSVVASYGKVGYKEARSYFDLTIDLMKENNNNAAILKYAIKVLFRQPLTDNAKKYCINESMHLAIIYPYLLPLLDFYIFIPYGVKEKQLECFVNLVYDESVKSCNYEGIWYAIYFSLKYNLSLNKISSDEIIAMDSCLARLFGMLYYKKAKDRSKWKQFRDDAKRLQTEDMDQYWIYIYETLTHGNLTGEWRKMKKANVSFLKRGFQY